MEHILSVNGKIVAKFMSLENALVVANDILVDPHMPIDIKVNDKSLYAYFCTDLSKANFKLFD